MAAEKKKGLITLKFLIRILQKHLHLSRRLYAFKEFDRQGVEAAKGSVPSDVKAGYFAVIAKNEVEEPIRFVVELCVLRHPAFLRLLELAEEYYGFQHTGALQLPCQPEELRRILLDKIY